MNYIFKCKFLKDIDSKSFNFLLIDDKLENTECA